MLNRIKKNAEVKMTKAEVVGFEDNRVFIHLQYTVKDDCEKKIVDFPKVGLPICTSRICLEEPPSPFTFEEPTYFAIKMYFDEAMLFPDDIGTKWSETILETYEKEMTLEEIEMKLGYPIKIIKERRNKDVK